ncbi:hypothetical protein PSI23_20255 [Xenorhabdus sp. XENO-10]|uniref:Uncharacterized protein n=1 Tax=Xenorhabdus yunnanensis TaxID=3025878 RepID=A0ABT5LKA7_9GAMM|nr:hypothetical protein [Xenorhabdus yunnanensis]MDC9591548.1 hypothetical protein [Xenorhabdus yunnanensis]
MGQLKINISSNRFRIEPDTRGGAILIIDDGIKWQLEGNGREIMLNTTHLERTDIISVLNDHYQDEEVTA